jgi:outer membrane protein, multidrug efflux system
VKRLFLFLLTLALLSSCKLGPDYRRPTVQTPEAFRKPEPAPPAGAGAFADLKWWEVFKDERLQDLLRTAMTRNYDLRATAARIEAALGNLGITRSNQLPGVVATATDTNNRLSQNGAVPLSPNFPSSQVRSFETLTLNLLSFELDVWGRLRRATEAARADLLAAEETRKAVMTTVVGDVAASYFSLREFDSELDIATRTLAARQETLRLIRARQGGGVATLLDLRQAEQLVYTAAATIPLIRQQIEQTENRLNLLLGQNPATISRGRGLTEQQLPPQVPEGLPSELLGRRPDIRVAEQNLIAANARIGAAKAAYFPQLSLTGLFGGQSSALSNLVSGPDRIWTFTPQLVQPVFLGGRLGSNVRLTEAQREAAVVQYERTIRTAFTEASDALIAHQRVRESRVQQELLVTALEDRSRLAYIRYRGGVDTLLNALDADRDLFQAQLGLSRIRLSELLNVVQLYKALGGGWQE